MKRVQISLIKNFIRQSKQRKNNLKITIKRQRNIKNFKSIKLVKISFSSKSYIKQKLNHEKQEFLNLNSDFKIRNIRIASKIFKSYPLN
jgi:hypothetical protein